MTNPMPEMPDFNQQQNNNYGNQNPQAEQRLYTGEPVNAPASAEDKTAAMIAHGSILLATYLSAGLLSFLGPLIVWFLYKDRSWLAKNAAAGSLNFSITVTLASWIAGILMFTVILIPVSLIIWGVVAVVSLIFPILAIVKTADGKLYHYPLTFEFLSVDPRERP